MNQSLLDDFEHQKLKKQTFMRLVAKLLSFALFFAGFIMIGLSDKKQGLHDMIVKTSVICTQKD